MAGTAASAAGTLHVTNGDIVEALLYRSGVADRVLP